MEENLMNILISVNEDYYNAAVIMLRSLFFHNKNHHVAVYVFHSELSAKRVKGLANLVERNEGTLHVIKINDEIFANVPVGRLTQATYYRLLAPGLLPSDLDRILYLDIDMIIVDSIDKIYYSDFNSKLFLAAPDTLMEIEEVKKNLRIKQDNVYINAGVLLMNLDLLRKEFNLDEALGYAIKFPDRVPNCDQDVINALYHKRIGLLEWTNNYEARFHEISEILAYPFIFKKILKDIKIIHYMGAKKPWKPQYDGKFLREYYRYSIHTPYEKEVRKNMQKRYLNILKLIKQMAVKEIKGKVFDV